MANSHWRQDQSSFHRAKGKHIITFICTIYLEDEAALGSDGVKQTTGLDGYAIFAAGLENLAHWDRHLDCFSSNM